MAEYIKRETVIKVLKDNVTEMECHIYFGSNLGIPNDEIEDIVNEIPTADVVEVVRCKDCKYFQTAKVNNKGFLICPASGMEITETDYCSYGERKMEDTDD